MRPSSGCEGRERNSDMKVAIEEGGMREEAGDVERKMECESLSVTFRAGFTFSTVFVGDADVSSGAF